MQLREYARVVWRRGWIILLIAAVGAVGAFGFSKLVTPIYRSTMTLSAVPARPDYGLSLTVKDLLHNYSQQIITTRLVQEVIDKLQLDIKPEKLKSEVTVAPDEANLLIVIEVKDPLQANAPKIAQALADAFVLKHSQDNLVIDQRDRILVDLHDGPTPVDQFFPNTRINVVAGGILGAVVGFFTVFLLEYLESANLRTAEDVEKALGAGVTVLGAIPPFTPEKKVKAGLAAQPVATSR
jgi:capsular polysaccharide biosynthesis protein